MAPLYLYSSLYYTVTMTIPSIPPNEVSLGEFFKNSEYFTREKNVTCIFWHLRYIEQLSPLEMYNRCLGMDRWLVTNVALDDFRIHNDKPMYGDIVFYSKIWFRNDIDLVAFRLRWGIPA